MTFKISSLDSDVNKLTPQMFVFNFSSLFKVNWPMKLKQVCVSDISLCSCVDLLARYNFSACLLNPKIVL